MEENTASTGPVQVDIDSLLKAGAHFGHQTERWNPKMLPFLYGERNKVHIINLDQTLARWERARRAIVDVVALGGSVLFVGTKLQGREIIKAEAKRCGAFSITERWLGGTLSNFQTLKNSIERMNKLEEVLAKANEEGSTIRLTKKEKLNISRELEKLDANLGGIRGMRKPPEILFVVDVNRESIAIAEARKLHIPVVALVDSNANPTRVSHPIPANDDAAKTIALFASAVADAVLEGRAAYESRIPKEHRERAVAAEAHTNGNSANGHSVEISQEAPANS